MELGQLQNGCFRNGPRNKQPGIRRSGHCGQEGFLNTRRGRTRRSRTPRAAGPDQRQGHMEVGRLASPAALPAVRDWLAVRGDHQGLLLNPVRKGGRLQERALSAQAACDLRPA